MRQSGFTLIELLVVLTLIGLVAGTVGPNFFDAAKRMGRKNDEQSIRQHLNALPLNALDSGQLLQINEQGAPIALPDGWQLTAKEPIKYLANGVCLGGTVTLSSGQHKEQQELTAPFCQWPAKE